MKTKISETYFFNVFEIELCATKRRKIFKDDFYESKVIRLHTDEGTIDINVCSNGVLHTTDNPEYI